MMNEQQQAEARKLLVDALIHLGLNSLHESDCRGAQFAHKNRHLPANHPVWKSAPACSCILGRIGDFLKETA